MNNINLTSFINICILLLLVTVSIWVFIDCKNETKSYYNSLFWALVTLFVIPPIGLLLYIFYKNKAWL